MNIWQIQDQLTHLWVLDSSQGCRSLVTQDEAYLWRSEENAKKALRKILKRHKQFADPNGPYRWYRGFEIRNRLTGKTTCRLDVDLVIVKYKVVLERE